MPFSYECPFCKRSAPAHCDHLECRWHRCAHCELTFDPHTGRRERPTPTKI